MAIIRQTNKKTGITYVIDSQSYWDKERKQTRAHRTVIGKVDPVTGEVIPTRNYTRKQTAETDMQAAPGNHPSEDAVTASESIDSLEMEARIAELEAENRQLREAMRVISGQANRFLP